MEEKDFQKFTRPQNIENRYSFWEIWGPVIINWLISFATGFVAASALAFVYFSADQDLAFKLIEDEALQKQFYDTLFKQYYDCATIIQGAASLIAIPLMLRFFKKDRVRFANMEPAYHPAGFNAYIKAAVMFLTGCFVMNSFIIVGNLSAFSQEYVETMEAFYTAPLAVQILALGIIVPLCEELVFRGLVFKRLRARESFLKSAFGSAVIFSIVHGNFVQILYAFCLGMMLAYSYEKFGSIMAPVIGHVVMNIFSVIATEFNIFDYLMKDIFRIAVATVICTAVCATMYVMIKEMDLKIKTEEQQI